MTIGRGPAAAAIAAMFLLQGCSTLWGSGENKPAVAASPAATPAPAAAPTPAAATSLASQCSQLEPYAVAGEDSELPRLTFEANLKAAYTKADTDGNGWLTRSELEPVNAARFAMNNGASPIQDWNGDGKIAFDEYASPSRTMFNMCDRNKDETISAREMGLNPERQRTGIGKDHAPLRPSPSPSDKTISGKAGGRR